MIKLEQKSTQRETEKLKESVKPKSVLLKVF